MPSPPRARSNCKGALAHATEGRMPSFERPSPAELRQPAGRAFCLPRASKGALGGLRKRRAAVCAWLRAATGPGGEGILPSHAPQGALVRRRLGHARLAARARARCPRPQGPVATARASPAVTRQPGGRAFCLPCASKGALGGLRKRRAGVCEWLRAATGPGGEGILPSLCAARRIGSEAASACAPDGASEGKMPSLPKARPNCKGVSGGNPSACREGFLPSPRVEGRARRPAQATRRDLRVPTGSDGPLGARASCPRYAPQGALVRRRLGHARLAARARARCPRPQGPVATARAPPAVTRQPAGRGFCLPCPSKGALGGLRKRRAGVCEWLRAATGPGGEGISGGNPSACREGFCLPCPSKGALGGLRKRRAGICEWLRAATGPGGEGILPSYAPQGALVRRRPRHARLVVRARGRCPSPPRARCNCKGVLVCVRKTECLSFTEPRVGSWGLTGLGCVWYCASGVVARRGRGRGGGSIGGIGGSPRRRNGRRRRRGLGLASCRWVPGQPGGSRRRG